MLKNKPSDFAERVKIVVRAITAGSTRSYGEVAMQAGNASAARAVGTLMRKNFDVTVPCHRVVRADGRCGEYNRGGEKAKADLLRTEGVMVKERHRSGKPGWFVARRGN